MSGVCEREYVKQFVRIDGDHGQRKAMLATMAMTGVGPRGGTHEFAVDPSVEPGFDGLKEAQFVKVRVRANVGPHKRLSNMTVVGVAPCDKPECWGE